MRTVAIIQARWASTRLPGKCMLQIYHKPLLEHIIDRLRYSKRLDGICVATTTSDTDDVIAELAGKLGIQLYRGSENDVLDRYYQAAKLVDADIICRVTSDDPFKDPKVLDQFIDDFNSGDYDYISNTIVPTYPEGIDIEVFRFSALERAWKEAALPSEHEHVTPYIWKNSDKFRLYNEVWKDNLSKLRWTVDKPEDWVFAQQVYERLYKPGDIFLMEDILKLLKKESWLSTINNHTIRNEGYLKSIAGEKETQ